MNDDDCTRFLQWALPQLQLRWAGFRRVRGQVCKRIARRCRTLGLASLADYRVFLAQDPQEWSALDSLCRITVTRFYRDKGVFEFLAQEVIPALIQRLGERGERTLRVWSIGCASGEEPYSLNLVWHYVLRHEYPDVNVAITASDADAALLQRAATACYPYGCIRNLPAAWRDEAFFRQDDQLCLKTPFRAAIEFKQHDVRSDTLSGPFDLVLCRNLVFTYFDRPLQEQTLQRLAASLHPRGALVIGVHERLPAGNASFTVWSDKHRVYSKSH